MSSRPPSVARFADEGEGPRPQAQESEVECTVIASTGNSEASELNFDRVAGLEMEKERIRSAFGRPNLAPLMYTDVPRGMLLYGPPGTGKSYLMRAFVHEIPYCVMVAPDTSLFQSSYYGIPAIRIRQFFECTSRAAYANDRAQKIALGTTIGLLFIDEIEAIGSSRTLAANANDNQRGAVVATLLQLLQGVNSDFANVYVVGATNIPWILDTALLRRLSVRIFFNIPDAPARTEIINTIFRRMYTPIEYSTEFTPKPDIIEEIKSGAAPVIIEEKSDELVIYDRPTLLRAIDSNLTGTKKNATSEARDVANAVYARTGIAPPPSIADIRRGAAGTSGGASTIQWGNYTLGELATYVLDTVQYEGRPYRSGQPLSNEILSFVGQKLRVLESAREQSASRPSMVVKRTPPQQRRGPMKPVDRYVLDNLWKLCLPYLQLSEIQPDEKNMIDEKNNVMDAYNTALENTFMTFLLKIPPSLDTANPDEPIRRELRRRRQTADALIRTLVQMSGPQTENQVRLRLQSMGIRNPRIVEQLLKTYTSQRGTDLNANGVYVFGYSASDLTQAIEQGINLAADRTFISGVRPCDPLTPNCFQKYGACTAATAPSSICIGVSRLDPIDRRNLQNFSLKAGDMFTAFDRVRSTVVPSEYVNYMWYEKNQETLPMAEASLV